MQFLRQLGGGVVIAVISMILVFGGITLALSETLPSQATPTSVPSTVSLAFPTATYTASAIGSEAFTASPTQIVESSVTNPPLFMTNTLIVQASCTPPTGWVRIVTTSGDTVYSLAQRYKTTAESLAAANCLSSFDVPVGMTLYVPPVSTVTVIPCGPPAGYVKTHVVQVGENLYRIALSYGITYPQLQRANCMGSSTTIHVGQVLWVPRVSTLTPVPGVTTIPDFPTATATFVPTVVPTFTASDTPVVQYP